MEIIKKQNGFTLIELMMVVAIIGVLAAIALPAYSDYTKRAYMVEAIQKASEAKANVWSFHASSGILPKNNTEAGLNQDPKSYSTSAIDSMEIQESGEIRITLNEKIAEGGILSLTPEDRNGSIKWTCSGNQNIQKYLPTTCKDSYNNR